MSVVFTCRGTLRGACVRKKNTKNISHVKTFKHHRETKKTHRPLKTSYNVQIKVCQVDVISKLGFLQLAQRPRAETYQ